MIKLTLGICSLKLRLQSMKMPSQHCRPNVLDFTDHGFGFVIHPGVICLSKTITELQNCEDTYQEITNFMKIIDGKARNHRFYGNYFEDKKFYANTCLPPQSSLALSSIHLHRRRPEENFQNLIEG